MSKPRIADLRRAEILKAFEKCIRRGGIEATTVQEVANAAGVQRTLINHYFGDKQALIAALIRQIVATSTRDFVSSLRDDEPISIGVELIFGRKMDRTGNLIEALRASSLDDHATRKLLREMYENFETVLCDYLMRQVPGAAESQCRAVSFSIMCLAAGASRITAVGFGRERRSEAAKAAKSLVMNL